MRVNYKNDARPPLLFVSGEHDHLMPPTVQRSNATHYESNTITEVVEFPAVPTSCLRRKAGRKSLTRRSNGHSPTSARPRRRSCKSGVRRVAARSPPRWPAQTRPGIDDTTRLSSRLAIGGGVLVEGSPERFS